nr:hypothetical protein GCM10020063_001330 [Dactylosporangium thailandense]
MTALRCDLRWKVAGGLPIDHAGFDPTFHPTTLTVWRNRLRAWERPDRIFEAVRHVVAETGVLSGKVRRALDSVVLDDAVATKDTVTQSIAAVRRVHRLIPGAADLIAARCHAHDWDDAGKPAMAWDDRAARDALVSALVKDADTIVAELAGVELDESAAQAVALLALAAGQDVEPADGSDGTNGGWRIAHRVAQDRVISTVDTQARHGHKTVHHRQDGYKAHVAIESDTGLFTAGELTMTCGEDNHDAVVGLNLLDNDPVDPPDGFEVLGDSAYGTGDARAALAQAGHTAIIKPGPLTPAVAGGFTLDDFAIDETADTALPRRNRQRLVAAHPHGRPQPPPTDQPRPPPLPRRLGHHLNPRHPANLNPGEGRQARCPATRWDPTAAQTAIEKPSPPIRKVKDHARHAGKADFGAACATCPLRGQCTDSKTGRSITIGHHEARLTAARTRQQDPRLEGRIPRHPTQSRTQTCAPHAPPLRRPTRPRGWFEPIRYADASASPPTSTSSPPRSTSPDSPPSASPTPPEAGPST